MTSYATATTLPAIDEGPVATFLTLVRPLLTLPGARWEASRWDVTTWCRYRGKTRAWNFVDHDGAPFAAAFGDVVKALFLYRTRVDGAAPETLTPWLIACRALYEALGGGAGAMPPGFAWGAVTLLDWECAEEILVGKLKTRSSRYSVAQRLQATAAFLAGRGVVPTRHYTHRQSAPRDMGAQHIDDRAEAMKKLPPQEALEVLADAAQAPRDERDRYLFAVIKLLVATGFRMVEVLTLPVDCLGQDSDGHAYLHYWPAKGGPLQPKWLATGSVEMVRDAVGTLRSLTVAARERAVAMEADPSRVPLLGEPTPAPEALVNGSALRNMLGLTNSHAGQFLTKHGIAPVTRGHGQLHERWLFRVDELERGLAMCLPEHRYELQLKSGGVQPLSRSLFIVPHNYFRGIPNLLFIEPLHNSAVEAFLATSTKYRRSVFDRYGLLDPTGRPWRITPHQFRHWMDTVAHKGGLSNMEEARWMGRVNPQQNRSYQHLDRQERIDRIKDAIGAGTVRGGIADVYHRLPVAERDAFLDAAVEAAHVTPVGICVHNFATKPCEYHLQCLTGCGDYLRTAGDERERRAIIQVKTRAEATLAAAERAQDRGGLPEAANWVAHQRRLVAGAERALAVDAAPSTVTGATIAVYPGAPSLAAGTRRAGGDE